MTANDMTTNETTMNSTARETRTETVWTELDSDVVVIGAGPTGLTAARDLMRQGRSVTVLEARERVGGRTWSDRIDGAFIEIGGQWISPDQTELSALVEELGLTTFSRYREGQGVYRAPDGTVTRYEGDFFPVSAQTRAEMERLIGILDELAAEIGAEEPWAHPKARELDTISFHQWLATLSDDEEARDNIGLFVAGGMLTKPSHAFSTLQAVLMAASAGSFSNLVDEDFILDKRVVGGMQSVSLTMAQELGERVITGHPVRVVRWQQEDPERPVLVDAEGFSEDGRASGTGVRVAAKRVIVAVPPNLYSRISFVPSLPRLQQVMHQHLSMGLVIKVHAVYDRPFWREQGLSGTAFASDFLVQEIYDNTNWDPSTGAEETRGTLVGFVVDERADEMFRLTEEERRARILDAMAELLGEEARSPEVFYLSDWGSQEWTRGAYATSYDLGGLHRWGAHQADPVGPVHWACSDIASAGYQHVDGAVRQGHQAASRVAEEL